MPRKTEPAYETENGVFPKRLKEIMKERGENQTSLAKKSQSNMLTGEILKSKQGHTPKDVSFGSIHKVQASDIVERILLSGIEDKLKKLKKKYDSSDSEANHK